MENRDRKNRSGEAGHESHEHVGCVAFDTKGVDRCHSVKLKGKWKRHVRYSGSVRDKGTMDGKGNSM